MNSTYRHRTRKFIAVLVAAVVFSDSIIGDAVAAPGARPLSPRIPAVHLAGSLPVPSADLANLAPLLSTYGTVNRAVPPASGKKWIVQIQDVHGNPTAQKNAEGALARLFDAHAADALVLEGQTRALDPEWFRSAPDTRTRDQAADRLFSDGRISGAAHLIVTRPQTVPAVLPLEDESVYRDNVGALRTALDRQPAFQRALALMEQSVSDLKKRHYNAEMFLIDLAISRYQAGEMPLTSVLALLRHRGQDLNYVTSALLRANTLETLYQMSEVGSELRQLLGRLRGRISDADSSVLFDAAFRFQKGQMGTSAFVSTLMAVTGHNGISLNDYPNLARHLERTLVARSIDPEKIIAAVDEIQAGLPDRLAVTPEERDVARLSRRLHLLGKLAALSLTSSEWTELCAARPETESIDEGVQLAQRRCVLLERAISPAKDFYRRASRRNESFFQHIAAAGRDRLIVVAGGFHSSAIAEAARRLGYGYVAFTPLIGDARSWDSSAPLRELAKPLSPFDSALEARGQTLTSRPLAASDHARIAAAAIARGTLNNDPRSIQWGRVQLGFFGAELADVAASRDDKGASVQVTIKAKGQTETIEVKFSANDLAFSRVTWPVKRFFGDVRRWFHRFYFLHRGIPINGVGLHTGKPSNVRLVPRKPGSGINFIRTDIPAVSRAQRIIPIILGFLGRNRSRYTGVESGGNRIMMVEHILFAMRMLDIWDADIYVDSEEMPVLDGSGLQYVEALKEFEGWSPKPPELRLEEPVVFWRDDNTMVLALPLEEGESDSEYGFALNFGNPQDRPSEFRMTLDDDDLGAARALVASSPTFLEKNLDDLRPQGLFRGGNPYGARQASNPNRAKDDPKGSVVLVNKAEDWANKNFDSDALARHKGGIDLVGDMMILEKTIGKRVKARFLAFGTGHRDTAELMLMLEMTRGGYRFPFQYDRVAGNLKKLLERDRISPEMYAYVMKRIEKYKDYDSKFTTAPHLPRATVPAAEIVRLKQPGKFFWAGGNNPMREAAMSGIEDYLFRADGAALATIADHIAKPQFRPEEITGIQVRVSEEIGPAVVCEVTFVLPGVDARDYPRVAMVVARPGHESNAATLDLFNSMNAAVAHMPNLDVGADAARAGDRTVRYFPLVGPFKSGVFSRQWLARDFARFQPSIPISDAAKMGDRLRFALLWEQSGGRLEGLQPDEMRRKDVAKAVATMMATIFIRLRDVRPSAVKPESVPMTGAFIDSLDLSKDLLFDPIDGRAALAYLRSTRMVSAETFLQELLHLTLTVSSSRSMLDGSTLQTDKEWQPFANDVASLLAGVEQALIDEYGPEKGRLGAIAWYERFLAVTLPRVQAGDTIGARTWAFRQQSRSSREGAPDVIAEKSGQEIVPLVAARIAVLKDDLSRQTSHAVILSMARGLSQLTGFPVTTWARLAPYTEGAAFAVMGFASVFGISLLTGGALAPGFVSAAIGMALWFLGHRSALINDGNEALEVPFGSLGIASKFRVVAIGILVAAIPAIGFSISPLIGIVATVVGGTIHAAANPSLNGRPLRLLDGAQRGMAALQREV